MGEGRNCAGYHTLAAGMRRLFSVGTKGAHRLDGAEIAIDRLVEIGVHLVEHRSGAVEMFLRDIQVESLGELMPVHGAVPLSHGKPIVYSGEHAGYLAFHTAERREYINVTPQVEEAVRKCGIQDGMVLVSAMHITATVYVNEAEDGLIADIDEWLEELTPFREEYRHHRTGEDR